MPTEMSTGAAKASQRAAGERSPFRRESSAERIMVPAAMPPRNR